MKKLLILPLVFFLVSCTTLNSMEKAKIAELELKGIKVPHEEVKNPGAAGALNILPGFGNFYLAVGTDESEHWLYGFLNLLLWPISVVWGVPEAAIDAANINKRNTVYYYSFGPGKDTLQAQTPQPATQSVPASQPAPAPIQAEPQAPQSNL